MQICETKDLSYNKSSHFEQCHAAECQQYCICQTTRLKLKFVACHMNIQKIENITLCLFGNET